jgi:hypothetical protein
MKMIRATLHVDDQRYPMRPRPQGVNLVAHLSLVSLEH